MARRRLQEATHDDSKKPAMTPRGPKVALRWPQDGPKFDQRGHKVAIYGPKTVQDGTKMASRWANNGPSTP